MWRRLAQNTKMREGPPKLTLPLNASNRANDRLDRKIGVRLQPAEENISPFGFVRRGEIFLRLRRLRRRSRFLERMKNSPCRTEKVKLSHQLIGPEGRPRMPRKGSYKGDTKGLHRGTQRGGRRRGQKISQNSISREFWDGMPRPG